MKHVLVAEQRPVGAAVVDAARSVQRLAAARDAENRRDRIDVDSTAALVRAAAGRQRIWADLCGAEVRAADRHSPDATPSEAGVEAGAHIEALTETVVEAVAAGAGGLGATEATGEPAVATRCDVSARASERAVARVSAVRHLTAARAAAATHATAAANPHAARSDAAARTDDAARGNSTAAIAGAADPDLSASAVPFEPAVRHGEDGVGQDIVGPAATRHGDGAHRKEQEGDSERIHFCADPTHAI